MQVKIGDKLRLRLQAYNGDTDVFPVAILRGEVGTAIGSPVPLVHLGNGLYGDDSVSKPAGAIVTATYVVYNDSGHTIESDIHARVLDVFEAAPALVLASPLQVLIGCDDQPSKSPITVVSTSDARLLISFVDDKKLPIDCREAAEVAFRVKKADGTALELTLEAGIEAVDDRIGLYLVAIPAADIGALPEAENDVQVELDLSGVKHVVQAFAAVSIQASVV